MRANRDGLFRSFLAHSRKALNLDGLSIEKLPTTAANGLRRTQIRGAIEQMRLFATGTTVFAPIVSFQAWNQGVNGLVIIWTLVMCVFSWWLLLRWRESYHTNGSEKEMAAFVTETQINASLYCLGMVLFYPLVTGNEKTVICAMMIGSLALGTIGFSHAPRAAFWYLGIHAVTMTTVPLITGLYLNNHSDLLLAALALVGGVAICNATLASARNQMKAFNDQQSLFEQSEVVDLLLKDYEEQGVEWIWRTDATGRITTCPQPVLELLSDYDDDSEESTLLRSLSSCVDEQGATDFERVALAFRRRHEFHDVMLPLYSETTGTLRWIMMRGRPQIEQNEFVGFRGIFVDATTRVETQKQVEFLAEKDPLTEAHNRNFIQKHLEELDPLLHKFTAYLLDLDGFKQVNDSYGHAIGDQLLQQVSERLKQVVQDAGIVARLGGDEFLVLIDDTSGFTPRNQDPISCDMLATLSKPFFIGQYDISISASIGTAKYPYDTTNGPSLLNQADLALYTAKQSGRNKCVHFEQSMQAVLQKRLVVTKRLRHALDAGLINPHYQPQICSKTHKVVGFEALARWTDTELGVVGPDVFIPIAEETGLIHEIGERMLTSACTDALTWTVPDGDPLPVVSVNVSPVQVIRGNMVQVVKSVLEQTGLPAQRLEIEVTESVLIEDTVGTNEILRALSDLGVRIALDDFGTGYSSLSYLRALPLHRLKIDQSFIADLDDLEAQSVVQTIIDLCHRLKLDVVAEGVETRQNVDVLTKMKCSVLQGYYFSRPVPAAETQDLLENITRSAA